MVVVDDSLEFSTLAVVADSSLVDGSVVFVVIGFSSTLCVTSSTVASCCGVVAPSVVVSRSVVVVGLLEGMISDDFGVDGFGDGVEDTCFTLSRCCLSCSNSGYLWNVI